MKSFILILAMWLLALLTIVSLEHKPANGGTPLVKTAAAGVPWNLNTRCNVSSRNLPRYVERIA